MGAISHKAALEAAEQTVAAYTHECDDDHSSNDEFLVARAYIERERQIQDAIAAIEKKRQAAEALDDGPDSNIKYGWMGSGMREALRIIREKLGAPT